MSTYFLEDYENYNYEDDVSTNKAVTKSAGLIAIATFCSRILGFIRDIIIAKFFGTAIYAQAFIVAFRIPNLFRDLVGEGAVNSTVVPIFSEYVAREGQANKRDGKEEFWQLANVVLNLVLASLIVLTILGTLFSPVIIRLIAPGFISEPEKLNVTIALTRYLFPYILLIGLSAAFMGILNSLKHFSAPAFGSCLLNIAIIVCALVFRENIIALASGVLIGGVLQLSIQIPVLLKKGLRWERKVSFKHPEIKRIGRLLIPRIFGTSIYQLNIFVDTILATLSSVVGMGGVAALYYANRIFQFPLAVFGISLAQAALPTMSVQAAQNDMGELKKTLEFSLRSILFITLPAAVGLMILSRPITKVLFERGQFDAYSTSITSLALLYYCFGLVFYGGVKVLTSAFYSLKDTSTPVKTASFCFIVNILFNLILMWPLKVGGLALATSISGACNFSILFFILRKRLGKFDEREFIVSMAKIFLASLIMGLVLVVILPRLEAILAVAPTINKFISLFLSIILGISIFLMVSFVLKIEELKRLLRWIFKRK